MPHIKIVPNKTVFDCFVETACTCTSPSKGSKTLVKHLLCLCRRSSRNSNLSQMGWKPLSTVFDWFVGLCVYLHSTSNSSKTLVNSFWLFCRISASISTLRQGGRRPPWRRIFDASVGEVL